MSASKPSDPTFRSYSADEANVYATQRTSYSQDLYDTVLKHHAATGGQFGLVVDVGCGPGNATRDVASFFDEAIGVDPGASMINTAKDLGGKTKSGSSIKYVVSPSEELSQVDGLKPGSVDLLTSAMAVSFDKDYFDSRQHLIKAGSLVRHGEVLGRSCHSVKAWWDSSALGLL